MDATWTADDEFVVCGENGLVEAYQLNAEKPSISESGFTTDTIATHGLSKSEWLPSMSGTWDKIRYDEESSLVALASTGEKKLATCRRISSGEAATWNSMDLPGKPTAVAFRSNPSKRDGDQTSSPLLAAAFEDGSCVLYTQHPDSSEAQSLVTLNVYSSPALALAWSPAGTHLAVSGIDLIQIWEIESLVHVNGESKQLEKKADAQMQALVTWRPDSTATGPRNGEHEGQQLTEPSLSWSQEGSGLVFAVDRQVSTLQEFLTKNNRDVDDGTDRSYTIPVAAFIRSEAESRGRGSQWCIEMLALALVLLGRYHRTMMYIHVYLDTPCMEIWLTYDFRCMVYFNYV